MKINRYHTGWAVKLWVLATVFLLPFLTTGQVFGWVVFGAVLGLAWKVSPEGPPETPAEPLPYADQYRKNEIPRPEAAPPPEQK